MPDHFNPVLREGIKQEDCELCGPVETAEQVASKSDEDAPPVQDPHHAEPEQVIEDREGERSVHGAEVTGEPCAARFPAPSKSVHASIPQDERQAQARSH